ncbi:hemolysin family protein [Clostridium sp. DJ247]|uniref:hemolysin family protein n=1 Tax=Clostridium sp. DJ247 TaxID=2726188 RepID=UPI00162562FF|nr:hemolysin family protein [Clostridium sp. DJ247]MBC2579746.1 HlyC/CorC family transporter [Clostridium sp. DJ247]
MQVLLNIILILLLVFMNGFFVAAEFAMVKIRKSRIETLMTEGNQRAKYTRKIVNDLNSYLSACQLGITLASLGLGWIGEPAIAKLLMPLFSFFNLSEITIHSISVIIAFTIITAFHIILGELAPKSLAIISTEKIALITSMPLLVFYKITYPIIWVFNHSTNFILRIFGISLVDEHEIAHTDEEIKLLVEESYRHGLIDQTELTLVDNIFDFSEKTVKDIMIPRTDMVCIYKKDDFDKILEIAMREQLTRYPVCNNSKDDIIGFVHIKDLYKMKIEGTEQQLNTIIRNIMSIPEHMSISVLFKKFQKEQEHIAVIIDEYGGTAGLVTIEDILEEIVGEIEDEFDEGTEEIHLLEDGSYVINGKVLIDDINNLLNINIKAENIDTIGGWIYSKIGTSPQIGYKIQYKKYEFIVDKCDRKRVHQVLIRKVDKEVS